MPTTISTAYNSRVNTSLFFGCINSTISVTDKKI